MRGKGLTKAMAFVLAAATVVGQSPSIYAAEAKAAELLSEETPEEIRGGVDIDEADGETAEEDAETSVNDEKADNDDTQETDGEDEEEVLTDEDTESGLTDETQDEAGGLPSESDADIELPEGVQGMPEGYVLSAREQEIKRDAIEHDIVGQMADYVEGEDYIRNQVFCLADSEEYAKEIAAAYGAELAEYTYGVAILDLSGTALSVADAVAIGTDPGYALPAVEPNYIIEMEPEAIPGSSYSLNAARPGGANSLQTGWEDWYYAMNNPDPLLSPADPNYQWWHDMIGTYGAWGMLDDLDLSDSGITVAVIDTGVNAAHEELTGHTTQYDVGGGKKTPGGHGSHVAGLVAASADNGKGGAGVAPGVGIMALCSANEDGELNSAYIISCIKFAADEGADIINMSLGGSAYSASQKEAIDYAHEKSVTICAATGNDSANVIKYPAAYDHVIGVAAVQQDGTLTTFSTYGNSATDIAAPGADMVSSYIGGADAYEKEQGTSMSCPVVAGACALYMSVMGHVDPDTMEAVLKKSATKAPSAGSGAGLLNVARMFEGDTTAPSVTLKDKEDIYSVDSDTRGGSLTVKEAVAKTATITLEAKNFEGATTANKNTRLLYTTDGKAPTVKNGEIVNGISYNAPLKAADLIGDATTPTKLTIKAAAITGMGVIGKVSTLTFTVDPQAVGNETVTILNAPSTMVAGKSVTLQAEVTSDESETVSQKVTWEVESDINATIKAVTGDLKTAAKKAGVVKVICTTADGKASDSRTIAVVEENSDKNALVSTIALSEKALSLLAGKSEKTVTLTELKNKAGDDLQDTVKLQWTTSNSAIVTVKPAADGKSAVIAPKAKGSATVTAKALDGSEKKATVKVTVGIPVSSITVAGQDYIVPGTSAAYKAASVLPGTAGTKTVSWAFADGATEKDGGDVTIDAKGVVKVLAGAAPGNYTVRATATDGSGVYGDYSFTVTEKKAGKVTVTTSAADSAYGVVSKSGTLSAVQLYTVNATSSAVDETELSVTGNVDTGINPVWSSNKANVVEVVGTGKTVTLKAKSAGTAIITCTANDGSKKSTKFTVKVIVPVSNLMLTNQTICTYADATGNQASNSLLAYGASNQTKVTLGSAYGKPSTTNVTWEHRIVKYDQTNMSYTELPSEADQKIKKAKLFTFSNGKVGVNKQFEAICEKNKFDTYDASYRFAVVVRATATDGTGIYAEKMIAPAAPINYLALNYKVSYGKGGYRYSPISSYTMITYAKTDEDGKPLVTASGRERIYFGLNGYYNSYYLPEVKVVSSNPDVASGFFGTSTSDGYPYIFYSTGKPGTAKLTITAGDGTNKRATLTIKVRKRVETVTVTGPSTIQAGKTGKYTAAVWPKDADNKAVEWHIFEATNNEKEKAALSAKNAADKVKISSTGVVTVGKNVDAGLKFQVFAVAKDMAGAYKYVQFETTN